MKAQRVDAPVTGAESWTVVDADYFPVDPAERYLAYLTAIERSPHTVREGPRTCRIGNPLRLLI